MTKIINVSLSLEEWKFIHRFLIQNTVDVLNIIQELEKQIPELKNE